MYLTTELGGSTLSDARSAATSSSVKADLAVAGIAGLYLFNVCVKFRTSERIIKLGLVADVTKMCHNTATRRKADSQPQDQQ